MNYDELKAKMDAYKSSVPALVPAGTANGTMSAPKVREEAQVETWTVTIKADPTTFTVSGGVSGAQEEGVVGKCYISDLGEVSFTLTQGTNVFADGDVFTFDVEDNVVGMNDVAEIRDINFHIHSKVDDVKVGYNAGKDQVCVIQVD